MTFARESLPFVVPFLLLAGLLVWLGKPGWAVASVIFALLVLLFFRDPHRSFEGSQEVILAAADGLVTRVDILEDPAVGPGRFHRVVTFLSVFDVHVQKVPTAGRVVHSSRTAGRKVAAFRSDADEVNENHLTVVERPSGDRIGIRQIAGLVARRVVCYLERGQQVERGQALGLIKFGSRVDLLVPESYRILVAKGDRVRNGETAMAQSGPDEGGAP